MKYIITSKDDWGRKIYWKGNQGWSKWSARKEDAHRYRVRYLAVKTIQKFQNRMKTGRVKFAHGLKYIRHWENMKEEPVDE